MLIRPRTPDDLSQVVELARSVHQSDDYPPYMPNDDFRRFIASSEALDAWVASMPGDRIVGHIALHSGSSPGVLDLATARLGVDPHRFGIVARLLVDRSVRRSGVGRRLLDHAATECRSKGLVPVLDVVDRFTPAISLYERAGWVRLGAVDVQLPDGSKMREFVYTELVNYRSESGDC